MSENEMAEKIKTIQYYRSKITDEEKKQFKQSRVYVMLMSRSIETLSNALGMESIQTRGLTKNVENSMNSGDFNAAIEACVSNKDTASIISNPVASFGATFCDILMQTHMNNIQKKSQEKKKKRFGVPENKEPFQKPFLPKNHESANHSLVPKTNTANSQNQNLFFQKTNVFSAEKTTEEEQKKNIDPLQISGGATEKQIEELNKAKSELETLKNEIFVKSAQLWEQKKQMEELFEKMQSQNVVLNNKFTEKKKNELETPVVEAQHTVGTLPAKQFNNSAKGSGFEEKLVQIVNNVAPMVEIISGSIVEETAEGIETQVEKPESFDDLFLQPKKNN